MNLRQVIDALTAKADEMPAGLDTEVRVSMCNGTGTEITRAIEVDHMAVLRKSDGKVEEVYVIVQGHPHRDEDVQNLRGIAEDADDYLHRWSSDDGANPDGPSRS